MAKPDNTHELLESNQQLYVLAQMSNKRLVAVKVSADIYRHKRNGKKLLAISDTSKKELASQQLTYEGMYMDYIPLTENG